MDDQTAVLTANQAFYDAFGHRDLAAMEALWAREHPVACIHPGWPALFDRDAVMQSWRRILGSSGSPAIRCAHARAFVLGEVAFVVCYELLADARLVATNIFAREGSAWLLVQHQAGPTAALAQREEAPSTQDPSRRLH
ncbi:MAG: DUF4440 domain-containing protein [Alphaproteobacteria bacterium]|nr:DUF4440 domain-containing protein [Alphaproteobacteria bacterium]